MSVAYYCVKNCVSYLDSKKESGVLSRFNKFNEQHMKMHFIAHMLTGIIAAYIAFMRNKNEPVIKQLLLTALAFVLGFIYIMYYLIFVQFFNINNESREDIKDLLATGLQAFS